ncbi:MAG: type VI secretion system tip protein VgrG, partial [Myxococcales bacterium]|nr:type VI secretion system tip protein VgrG [Myxococcales bacterium]
MSDDEQTPGTGASTGEGGITGTIAQIAGGAATGLGTAAESIGGEEGEALETAGDVVGGVADVVRAAEAARNLGEAIEADSEGRIASATGDLIGGVVGATGAGIDAIAGVVPEEARGALNTAADIARGVAGAARSTQQVVSAIEHAIDAAEGPQLVFRTRADLGSHPLRARGAHGRRALSGLYEFSIHVEYGEDGGLDDDVLDDLLTHSAQLGLNRDTLGAGEVYGALSRIDMRGMTGPRPTHYDLTLVPKLWRLTLTRRTRVYQDMSHLEVVLEVLRQHGFDSGTHVFDHTEETYPTREYTVQYDETDFDFISRLLAHHGIHYHFNQDPGTEAIVLADRNAAFEPVAEHERLHFHPHEFPADDNEPRVWNLRRRRAARSRGVVLRDYNWRTPHHPLRAAEEADERSGYGFLDEFGAHFRDDAEGATLATIRAEALRVERETFTGITSLRGVQPGAWFELEGHPNPDFNQRYLVIGTSEDMDDGHHYTCEFTAIPFEVTYRPPRTVPWPRIEGLINGIVDGDGDNRSTATPIDDQGRYRVVIPYDEAAAAGGRASRWVRRAQASAGAGYGMHLPLHIGTEV